MCLTIGIMSVVQWGPYWFPFVDTMMDCKTYWWANVLLISNLLPIHEIVSAACNSDLSVITHITHRFISMPLFFSVYSMDMVPVS